MLTLDDGFKGWTTDAIALVQRAIVAHGGVEQWRAVESIRLPFLRGSGLLLRMKGYGLTFSAPREFEVQPYRGVTVFHGYPDDDHQGRYFAGNVTIERADGGGARPCHVSFLSTMNFQAPAFYEKRGYTAFGELPHAPQPYGRTWFAKQLTL